MIEIRGLSKIYQTETKNNVEAIKNLSINFPEKGIVFLLGKSGSGKSTLLNILGGLDKPTNGELLIEGKSTKNFSNYDFDIYRNTYVGIVFQDFNIIEELNVKDNISLSLQLQNANCSDSKISDALKKVDLDGLGDRKPKELSGGQRQRVAIARALIKNPNLILADEPTGSLDSETSYKIFELLKNISRERLVIIASHDKESAEKYGDRIIELKDGSIIKDLVKENNETDISGKEKLLKKPKLPFKVALRIALSNFKIKKLKFSLSLLLTSISFAMFGVLSSIMTFDKNETLAEALQNADYSAISVEKTINNFKSKKICFDTYGDNIYEFESNDLSNSRTLFTEKDICELNECGFDFVGVFNPTISESIKCQQLKIDTPLNIYFDSNDYNCFSGFSDCGEQYSNKNFNLIKGRYPADSSEIAISLYKANGFLCSINKDGNKQFHDLDSLINSEINLFYGRNNMSLNMKICGIFETEKIPQKFEELKSFPGCKDDALIDEWKNFKNNSFLDIAFVSKDFYEKNIKYFDYDIKYIGDAKLENATNLYSCIDEQCIYFRGRESEYRIENVIPFNLFKEHLSEFEISNLNHSMENIDLKDNEILITEDFKELIQRKKFVALLNDIKIFYNKDSKFSNPFKVYVREMNDLFSSTDFLSVIQTYSNQVSNFPDTDLNSLDQNYNYLNDLVGTYYEKASKRELFYTTLLKYGYDNECEMFNNYLKSVYDRTLTFGEITSLKTWTSKCLSFNAEQEVIDFSDTEWESIESFFEKYYENTVGLYRGIEQYEFYMPYSSAVEQVDLAFNNSSNKEALLNSFKIINDRYNSFSDLCESFYSGALSDDDVDNIMNSMFLWNEGLPTISYYKYGIFAERFPYEKSYDLLDSSGEKRVKTVGFYSFKDQNLKHAIVANSNTLRNLRMMISENNENTVNSYDYEFSNEGKYTFLLSRLEINKNNVKVLNSSYGKYSLNTSDDTSSLINKALKSSETIKWVALIVGVSFGLFSSLLLFSFITDSISNKEKEIGILRSLGASVKDVFKTFIIESIIMSILSIVFANIIGALLILFINKQISSNILGVYLFKYNLLVISIIVVVSLTVSILSSLGPIMKICKKNTIDAIRKI